MSVVDSGTLVALGIRRARHGFEALAYDWWWTGPRRAPSDALAVALLAGPAVPGTVVGHPEDLGRGRGPAMALKPGPDQPPLVLGGRVAATGLGMTLVPDELPTLLISPPGSVARRRADLVGVRATLRADEIVLRTPVDVAALYRGGVRQPLPWIPVTSVPRTVQDAAGYLGDLQLLWLVEQALGAKADPTAGASRREHRRLAQLVGRADARSRSPLETAVRLLLLDAGLPRPESNARVLWHESSPPQLPGIVCDLVWAAQRVIVECDGLAWHSGGSVISKDAARHRALQRAGWAVLRVTWDDVRNRPEDLLADVRATLDR